MTTLQSTDIGEVPTDWEVLRLRSCLTTRPDYGINAAAVDFREDLPAYLRITDITADGRYSAAQRASLQDPRADMYFLSPGEIVFARTGASVGKSYLYDGTDGRLAFAGFLIRVRPDPRLLDPRFLAAYLTTDRYWQWIRIMSARSGQPGVNGNEYGDLPVPVPPLEEQRRIAGVLDDTERYLVALQQLAAKKADMLKALTQRLVDGTHRLLGFDDSWRRVRLGDVVDLLGTASNPRSDLVGGSVGYVHYGDIHMTTAVTLDPADRALPSIASELVRGVPRLRNGDIIMVDASEDPTGIGKAVEVANIDGTEIVAGLHTLLLRPHEKEIAPGFGAYVQFMTPVRTALERLATGVSVYGITRTAVRDVELILPALPEQTAIRRVLGDATDELTAIHHLVAKLRDIKQGLTEELLSGRTRLA